jgi:hypothetical protein
MKEVPLVAGGGNPEGLRLVVVNYPRDELGPESRFQFACRYVPSLNIQKLLDTATLLNLLDRSRGIFRLLEQDQLQSTTVKWFVVMGLREEFLLSFGVLNQIELQHSLKMHLSLFQHMLLETIVIEGNLFFA